MSKLNTLGGVITITGVTLFITVVLPLHLIHKEYDPINQLMSELALEPYGGFMILAFMGLALSSLGVQIILINQEAHFFLQLVLSGATICFAGSGIFTLGNAATVHIFLIASAFVLAGLAMYLFPLLAGAASSGVSRYISWGLAIAMACSVVLGNSLLPMGIGQRLAATFLLAWFAILGWCFIRNCPYPRKESG